MGRILWHGTTRKRAEAILRSGPDPQFREPFGSEPAEGFSTAPPRGPYLFGDPQEVARLKAKNFPDEGGPAILEMEVPEELVAKAINNVSEIRFWSGYGLEELCDAWTSIPKRIL
jgi:hypothetical protein